MTLRLDDDTRRLVVEAGLAAVNNGLYPQAEAIRHALPLLSDNAQARAIVHAVMLIGLHDPDGAARVLHGDRSDAARLLHTLITAFPRPRGPSGR
ncbi:EscG/YscG/SsaH family type III secretion system needle protein co-chaperone [Aeromonas salmonicida]|uniref:EscG/YscG/SsaH family type III secretion system needle protein co-chaperone n=1 Tax=Aeromonas salmonicida TaxID=645 RepID=UPI00259EAC72|nr:EscG/YscG/SsaH family type III secretion system needle protein co-chaperone [Aeromonas salmonicida]MDM5065368.1 EscG/YscG/SsaH family type III secretion system needle protein co-chaperone [Aeromonas salmonicida]